MWAAEALGKIGNPQAVEHLIILLKDLSLSFGNDGYGNKFAGNPRLEAIKALEKINDKRAVTPLKELVEGKLGS